MQGGEREFIALKRPAKKKAAKKKTNSDKAKARRLLGAGRMQLYQIWQRGSRRLEIGIVYPGIYG